LGAVISRRFSLGQKLAPLAPLLLLVVSLPSQMILKCRMDGSVRAACCCPDLDGAEQETPTPATVKPQSCCDPQIATNEARIMELPPPAQPDVVLAAPVWVALAFDAPASRAVPRVFEQGGPAREGPPLVLLKQSFLI
jgi:hypothetical protein